MDKNTPSLYLGEVGRGKGQMPPGSPRLLRVLCGKTFRLLVISKTLQTFQFFVKKTVNGCRGLLFILSLNNNRNNFAAFQRQ